MPACPRGISTHSPRAGRTPRCQASIRFAIKFQLTRPVRGEPADDATDAQGSRISTHSPRAGRTPLRLRRPQRVWDFNSLAPCGANRASCPRWRRRSKFQLTRPVRGEPSGIFVSPYSLKISTHSPRAGRTYLGCLFGVHTFISTHSPRAGRTIIPLSRSFVNSNFNSLAPCGANPL